MIVDGIVIAVLLMSAVIAFLRGFIREVLTILGVGGGLAAAYFGGPILSVYVQGMLGVEENAETPQRLFGIIPYEFLADIIAYGLLFVIVVIVLSLLSHALAEGAKSVGLGAIDRTLGVFFGILRGVLLLGLMYLPVYIFVDDDTKAQWIGDSRTRVYLDQTAQAMASLMPEDAQAAMEGTFEEGKDRASQAKQHLETIDVLKQKGVTQDDVQSLENSGASGSGYNDAFRQQMDRLFENEAAGDNINTQKSN